MFSLQALANRLNQYVLVIELIRVALSRPMNREMFSPGRRRKMKPVLSNWDLSAVFPSIMGFPGLVVRGFDFVKTS